MKAVCVDSYVDPLGDLTKRIRAAEGSRFMIRFVPGFIAAIGAFWVPKATAWLDSLWLEMLVYLGVYALLAVSVDTAMKRYGQKG